MGRVEMMKIRMIGWAALLVLSLGIVTGCGSYKNTTEKLRLTATSFNENLRWNRLVAASKSIPASKRSAWIREMRSVFSAMRIVDYNVTPVRVGSTRALVDISLAYYYVPDPTVRRERRRQVWRLSQGNWLLESDKKLRVKRPLEMRKMPDFESSLKPKSDS